MHVLVACDKFRGTADAAHVCASVAAAVEALGHTCAQLPLADGGEGTLDALGGANRVSTVTGPLGDPVDAPWRMDRRTAIIEMARASGLDLVGGADGNDPVAASTHGTGELIATAIELGAKRIVLGLGGSATTDGGLGAQRALMPHGRLRGIDITVACDVRTRFLDAARVFAPQKGATPAQVELLTRRLERLADVYLSEQGVDVRSLEGAGAAGGLAGGLAALGAHLVSGFELVADELDLDAAIDRADLVVTGEGFVDEESFDGKVVGGVIERCADAGTPVLVVAGDVDASIAGRIDVVSLVARFGLEEAMWAPEACIELAVKERLSERGGS